MWIIDWIVVRAWSVYRFLENLLSRLFDWAADIDWGDRIRRFAYYWWGRAWFVLETSYNDLWDYLKIYGLKDYLRGLRDRWSKFWNVFVDWWANTYWALYYKATEIYHLTQTWYGQLRDLADRLFGRLQDLTDRLFANLNALADRLFSNLNTLADRLFGNLQALADRLFVNLQTLADRLFVNLNSLADRLFANLQSLADRLFANLQALADRLFSNLNTLADTWFGALWAYVVVWLNQAGHYFGPWWTAAWNWYNDLYAKVKAFWDAEYPRDAETYRDWMPEVRTYVQDWMVYLDPFVKEDYARLLAFLNNPALFVYDEIKRRLLDAFWSWFIRQEFDTTEDWERLAEVPDLPEWLGVEINNLIDGRENWPEIEAEMSGTLDRVFATMDALEAA